MAVTLRKDTDIYLISHYQNQIVGNKLPSNRQVLSVLFFNLRHVKLNLNQSIDLVIKEVIIFWEKSKIPIQHFQRCKHKLNVLYDEFRLIKKNKSRKIGSQKQKEGSFMKKLDNLFDIAHADALSLITIEEDKKFLINQRKPGRPGSIGGIDVMFQQHQNLETEKTEKTIARKRKAEEQLFAQFERAELLSSTSTETSEVPPETLPGPSSLPTTTSTETSEVPTEPQPGPSSLSTRQRGRKEMITEKLVAVFDKCQISDREAVHILMAAGEGFGVKLEDFIINRTSIQRCRQNIRKKRAVVIKERFGNENLKHVVVHWDGKLLPDISGKKMAERLPIIISSGDSEQILHVPELPDSTGKEQAKAVYQALVDWDLHEATVALCCDTTASNLGRLKCAAVILEQLLEKDMMYLPCRHHIFELILRAAFDIKMPASTGPKVPLFQKFQKEWDSLNKKVKPFEDRNSEIFKDETETVLNFCKEELLSRQSRDDYKEFLELVILFLGGTISNSSLKVPGAVHHARWMAKAIYCLKIYLLRFEFQMENNEEKAVEDICIFIAYIYVVPWFRAPSGIKAPAGDLDLIRKITNFQKIDPDIGNVTFKKFLNHLWYLSSEGVAFAFFDNEVPNSVKENMKKELGSVKADEDRKKYECTLKDVRSLCKVDLSHFVCSKTKIFFERFGLNMSFLDAPVSKWSDNEDYNYSRCKVEKIRTVNDTAERGVKLIQEYNSVLTKSEEQRQYILQVVGEYRKKFPQAKKTALMKKLV